MKRAGRRSVVFAEYMLWFLMTAVIIMVAVLVYDKVSEATDSRAVIALVIIAVICALAGLLTALDALRRTFEGIDAERRFTARAKPSDDVFRFRSVRFAQPRGKLCVYLHTSIITARGGFCQEKARHAAVAAGRALRPSFAFARTVSCV